MTTTYSPDYAEYTAQRNAQATAQDIDRRAAEHSRCRKCGHKGLRYSGDFDNGQYTATATCPACGKRFAF